MTKKEFLFGLITVGISLFVCLMLAEIILRFLPVNEGMRSREVTYDQPVLTFEPDEHVLWSRDWNFSIINHVRVNAQGFVNRYDYETKSDKPVLAVVGDSYVEAAMVPYEETVYGRLEHDARTQHGGRYRVYSFGASGAPLSQYLIFARHARETYNADKMIFIVIANDFDESLPKYRFQDTFHQFRRDENGKYQVYLPREFRRKWVSELARESALVRYLFFNVQLWQAWWNLKSILLSDDEGGVAYVGNTVADMSETRLADSRDVVDAFFRLLPDYTDLPPQDIAFVVDAPRHQLYQIDRLEDLEESYFTVIRTYFIEQARQRGYEVIDMAPLFFEEHKATGVRFEFPTDGHWSGEGHRAAYEALREASIVRDFQRNN